MRKIKLILLLFLIIILVGTRFINISWGLPYPIHPDERNMAIAIQNLSCDVLNLKSNFLNLNQCFNPKFFAYGQFPLYLGYVLVFLMKFFDGDLGTPISFSEATISLRIISALASILNALVLLKIMKLLISNYQFPISNKILNIPNKDKDKKILNLKSYLIFLPIIVFAPFFIQFSHFGTTESLLMLFYSSLILIGLKLIFGKTALSRFIFFSSFILGMAIATKASSVIFFMIPSLSLLFADPLEEKGFLRLKKYFFLFLYLTALTLIVSLVFSPHNFISFGEFLGSMRYESDVALGSYVVFYTRQFEHTLPVLFQAIRIFPFALGFPVFILFVLGFFLLPFNRPVNFLRAVFLVYFLPTAFMFAKWTRFMAPIFPVMVVIAVLFLQNLVLQWFFKGRASLIFFPIIVLMIVPGLAYVSIYTSADVRFQATEWIYKNIPEDSYVLFETANVLDIPVPTPQNPKNYNVISFNFYDIDENRNLFFDLQNHLAKAQYILVPSRRIFANHYCPTNESSARCNYLRAKYPQLHQYYDDLFSGKLGFEKVAEFSSFPKIALFGRTILELPDEQAEETWTVFDHPVIRIYKRVQ